MKLEFSGSDAGVAVVLLAVLLYLYKKGQQQAEAPKQVDYFVKNDQGQFEVPGMGIALRSPN